MKLYNNATKQLETLPNQKTLSIYSCGPTVYDYAHIGNMRTFLFEDLMIRSLSTLGYEINHVRNITDIDDKILERIQSNNTSLKEFTQKYTEIFFQNLKELNFNQSYTRYLNATDYVNKMIDLIQELINKGFAYDHAEGVYFRLNAFPNYGDFKGLDLANIQNMSEDQEFSKEDLNDFVLWKKHKPEDGSVFWESPWGKGRPGWHTECAAIVRDQFPQGLDIHTGGIDLLFPHHTNEKAHCECLDDRPMSKFWVHSTHLLVNGKKMSKSLGNFYTIKDLQDLGYSNESIRFYLQTEANYQSQLNFTLDGLKGASSSLKRINNFIQELLSSASEQYTHPPYQLKERFFVKIKDNLNISGAMGEIFTLINGYYSKEININSYEIINDLKEINHIIGVLEFTQELVLSDEIQQLLDQRTIARQNKEWSESDRLRDELLTYGIEVRDSKEGTTIRKL